MLGLAFVNTFFLKNDLLPGNRRLLRKALVFINTSSAILHEYQVASPPPAHLLFANTKETSSFPACFNLQALLQHICWKEVQRFLRIVSNLLINTFSSLLSYRQIMVPLKSMAALPPTSLGPETGS